MFFNTHKPHLHSSWDYGYSDKDLIRSAKLPLRSPWRLVLTFSIYCIQRALVVDNSRDRFRDGHSSLPVPDTTRPDKFQIRHNLFSWVYLLRSLFQNFWSVATGPNLQKVDPTRPAGPPDPWTSLVGLMTQLFTHAYTWILWELWTLNSEECLCVKYAAPERLTLDRTLATTHHHSLVLMLSPHTHHSLVSDAS